MRNGKHHLTKRDMLDLSKALDTVNPQLLLVKLNAEGFDKNSLQIIQIYLSNRWKRTKIKSSFSLWSALLKGLPEGSVLGPIVFNRFLNDLFFILKNTESCNFADDTTPHACDTNLDELLMCLENDTTLTVRWFESNYMRYPIISGNKLESHWTGREL